MMQPSCWERNLKCQCYVSSDRSYLNATAMHKTAAAHWLVCPDPSFAQSFLTASLIGAVILLCRSCPASILPWKMFQKRWWMQFFSETVFCCSHDALKIWSKVCRLKQCQYIHWSKKHTFFLPCPVFFITRLLFFLNEACGVVVRQCSFCFWFCYKCAFWLWEDILCLCITQM